MTARASSFKRDQRLSGRLVFANAFERGVRAARGPLVVFAVRNVLKRSRWGLSVSRRVGTAVARNRIKRLLREAIRLSQHELPAGYDVVIVVKAHAPLMLGKYQQLLGGAMERIAEARET